MKWTLRTFLLAVLIVGATVCLTWEYLITDSVKLDQRFTGRITSGQNSSVEPLTAFELEHAVKRQYRGRVNRPKLDIENAAIEEFETIKGNPRDVPLIGFSELHRTIYKCVVEGREKDGRYVKKIFYVEKNHFHLLDE